MRKMLWTGSLCWALASAALSQVGPNPPYLAEMPSVERVMREVQGTDPEDSLSRQMGAYAQLKKMVEDAAGPRRYRNQLTPDEARLIAVYDAAFNRLYATLGPKQLRGYDVDPRFRDQLAAQFGMRRVAAQVGAVDASYEAKRQAREQAEQQQMEAARERQSTSPAAGTADPGTLAARRCAAAGRSLTECLGEAVGSSLHAVSPGAKLLPPGLRLHGIYTAPGGLAISFAAGTLDQPGSANLQCGKIEGGNGAYAITVRDGATVVTVPNRPVPLTLTLRADGRLDGPASARVDGQVVVGYKPGGPVTKTESHMAGEAIMAGDVGKFNAWDVKQERNGQFTLLNSVSTTSTVMGGPATIYRPASQQCPIGTLAAAAPVRKKPAALAAAVADLAGASSREVPVGVRLSGVFRSPDGARLEFRPDLAVLDCGEVQISPGYSVEVGERVSVRLQSVPPIVLAYRPEGLLAGPVGAVRVNGRVLTGVAAGGQPTFAPRVVACSLESLAPAAQ